MAKNVLAMSDEEIMELSPEDFEEIIPSGSENENDENNESEEFNVTDEEPDENESDVLNKSDDEVEVDEESEEDKSDESEEESTEDNKEESKDNLDATEEEKAVDKDVKEEEAKADEKVDTPDAEVDYKTVYTRIMETPIKANGKELKLKSVDEAIQLIQMGADYTKKMAGLKPHRKILKTLENNNLLNENDINFLVDLKQKKPEAIAKLLADSEINPLDIDVDASKDYKPSQHSVTDSELILDEVIKELQDSPHYGKLSKVVGVDWDDDSKRAVFKDPEQLKRLHSHMIPDAQGNSLYDTVNEEVTRRRMLGQLPKNMSDYDAYISVGNDLYEQAQRQQQAKANTVEKRVVKPATKPNNVEPEKVKSKKMAAAPTKGKATKSSDPDFNPLNMSDEEFEKISANHY